MHGLWVSPAGSGERKSPPFPRRHLVPPLLRQAVTAAAENSASLRAFCSQGSGDESVAELFPFFTSLPCRDFQMISLKCLSPHLAACLVPRRHDGE